MKSLLAIMDFPDMQYKQNSGTPALIYTIQELAKKYVVHIISPYGTYDPEISNVIYHRLNIPKSPVVQFEPVWFWFWFLIASVMKGISINSKYQFSVIYGCGCTGSVSGSVIGIITGIPNVSRLYGTFLGPYIGKIFAIRKFQEILAFISPSKWLIVTDDGTRGDQVAKWLGVSDKLFFMKNGVDDFYCDIPDLCSTTTGDIWMISLARLVRWKRVDRIITAFGVPWRCKRLKLRIVGDGPEMKSLKHLAKELGVEKDVVFYGEVDRETAGRLLAKSDIYISTNDVSNVSNSLMESMFCGKAIIALNTGDTGKVIENKTNGMLVNEKELPYVIKTLCFDDALREKLGKNARTYALANFKSWDIRIDHEVGLIMEVSK